MKRIEDRLNKALPSVALYRDDIELIIEKFKGYGFDVVLSDQEYEFTDITEFIQKRGTRPTEFQILGTLNYERVLLNVKRKTVFGGVWLQGGTSEKGKAITFDILDIFKRRRTLLARLLGDTKWGVIGFVIYLFGICSYFFPAVKPARSFSMIAGGFLMMLGGLAGGVRIGLGSSVNLELRHEASTFLSRNSDKLIVSVFSALFGALVTLAPTKYFG